MRRYVKENSKKSQGIGPVEPGMESEQTFRLLVVNHLSDIQGPARFVEMGCGLGAFAIKGLKSHLTPEELKHIEYIGVGIDQADLTDAKEIVVDVHGFNRHVLAKEPRFILLDDFFQHDNKTADVIFLVRTLHDIPLKDLPREFYQIFRILKPGGRLIIFDKSEFAGSAEAMLTIWKSGDVEQLFKDEKYFELNTWPIPGHVNIPDGISQSHGEGQTTHERRRMELIAVMDKRSERFPSVQDWCTWLLEIYTQKQASYRKRAVELEAIHNKEGALSSEEQKELEECNILAERITKQLMDFDRRILWDFSWMDHVRKHGGSFARELKEAFAIYMLRDVDAKVKESHSDAFSYVPTPLSRPDSEDGSRLDKQAFHATARDSGPLFYLDKILEDPLRTRIFVGGAGVGKTSLFRHLEIELLDRLAGRDYEGRVPVYIFLPDLGDKSIESILAKRLERFLTWAGETERQDVIRTLKENNRLLFLFDSFDQIDIRDETKQRSLAVFKQLLRNSDIGRDPVFYVSTRPNNFDNLRQNIAPEVDQVVAIEPFSDQTDANGSLQSYMGDNAWPEVKKVLAHSEKIAEVVQIPLFAKKIKEIYFLEKGKLSSLSTKSDVFRILYDRFRRWEQGIGTIESPEVSFDRLSDLVEELSCRLLEEGLKQQARGKEVKNIIRALQPTGYEHYLSALNDSQFFEYLRGVYEAENSFFWEEADIRYHHLSIQEYLAARHLATLYRNNGRFEEWRSSMVRLAQANEEGYLAELGDFFAEITTRDISDSAAAIDRCHKLFEQEDNQWVLTYLLRLRDELGNTPKGQKRLAELFAEEDKSLRPEENTGIKVFVPAGPFVRGSHEYQDEWPVRLIRLDDFAIDRYPVTNRRFLDFLREWRKMHDGWEDNDGNQFIDFERSAISADKDRVTVANRLLDHPITGVTWHGARAFCAWRAEQEKREWRLPFEAEWEKAARGLWGRRYPWGNDFDPARCNTREGKRSKDKTSKVDRYPDGISPYGCFDMAGNVWEWCQDSYQRDFYREAAPDNPVCNRGGMKVLRGGSWNTHRNNARCATRFRFFPDDRYDIIGFRCARTVK